jgi:hypothetical protein
MILLGFVEVFEQNQFFKMETFLMRTLSLCDCGPMKMMYDVLQKKESDVVRRRKAGRPKACLPEAARVLQGGLGDDSATKAAGKQRHRGRTKVLR